MSYISKNRHKFYLKCHLIFVCKYRKQLLVSNIRECVLSSFKEIESNCDFEIEIMETDRDHIHLLINYPPNITVTSIVRILKQVSTNILYAQSVKQTLIPLESTSTAKVDAIHPIN